ncbi:MAG: arylsulfatase [Planctomycetota bacterium]
MLLLNRYVLAMMLVVWAMGITSDAADRPNIVYIMTDDLGYGDLGCYGQETVQTPNLDQMAREGMRFTDHYAGHTVCRPSRLVLWTGQHVGHTGLIDNQSRSLTGDEATVAKLLKRSGYVTGGVGKWALGNVDQPEEVNNAGHPNNNGFDYWCGYLNQSNAHNFYPTYLWENKKQLMLPGNVIGDYPNGRGRVASQRVTYSHDVMTDRALQFVRDHYQEPFLLHIHWTIPHANNEGGRVLGDGMEVPSYGQYEKEDWPNTEKGFAAMVSRMDADVGRLFKLLKDLKIDENTIVFFTSDNGPHNEGGHDHKFFDSNGPLKGFKRSMHEGGIRVPMIVRWPGVIKPGATTDLPSAFWDFLPTACELAGVDIPAAYTSEQPTGTDGVSLVPTLRGKPGQQRHEYLYWASQAGETSVGVRMNQWKLVQYRANRRRKETQPDAQPDWRLYDLTNDLGEEHDLASEHPEIVTQMLGFLERDEL